MISMEFFKSLIAAVNRNSLFHVQSPGRTVQPIRVIFWKGIRGMIGHNVIIFIENWYIPAKHYITNNETNSR